jgi:hypothetical protein
LPVRVIRSNSARSTGVNVTRYFFSTTASLPENRLEYPPHE